MEKVEKLEVASAADKAVAEKVAPQAKVEELVARAKAQAEEGVPPRRAAPGWAAARKGSAAARRGTAASAMAAGVAKVATRAAAATEVVATAEVTMAVVRAAEATVAAVMARGSVVAAPEVVGWVVVDSVEVVRVAAVVVQHSVGRAASSVGQA